MITPVRTFGYCFSYTGGIQKQLKGSLSYYKIKFESIVRSALHFEALGLTNTFCCSTIWKIHTRTVQ